MFLQDWAAPLLQNGGSVSESSSSSGNSNSKDVHVVCNCIGPCTSECPNKVIILFHSNYEV
jgi:hypothetical protein